MNKIIRWIKLSLSIVIMAGMILSPGLVFAADTNHKPITQELITLVKKDPKIRNMLEASIAEAAKINPDKKTNPVQNLSSFIILLTRPQIYLRRIYWKIPTILFR